MGKNEYGQVEIWVMGGGRVKNEGEKKVFQNYRHCYPGSYALTVSVNGVICVFVAHFRSSGTFESL